MTRRLNFGMSLCAFPREQAKKKTTERGTPTYSSKDHEFVAILYERRNARVPIERVEQGEASLFC